MEDFKMAPSSMLFTTPPPVEGGCVGGGGIRDLAARWGWGWGWEREAFGDE